MKFYETRVPFFWFWRRGGQKFGNKFSLTFQISFKLMDESRTLNWCQGFSRRSFEPGINSSSMRLHANTNMIRQQKQHFNLRLSKCYAMSCFPHNALSLRQHYLGLKVVISFRSSVRLKWYQTNTVNGITITIYHKTDWKVSGAGSPCEWH